MISIQGMEFFAYHGCSAEEQKTGNNFLVDFYLKTDLNKASTTDNLTDTIDYQTVYLLIKKEMEIKSKLLEHVARRILDSVCKTFPLIEEAKVRITKINPQFGGKIHDVSIMLSTKDIKKL
jgi:dihydroneopterin aldolase